MKEEVYELALEAIRATIRRQEAGQKIRTARALSENAHRMLERAEGEERFYELCEAAAEFVSGGKLFPGGLSEPERKIAIRAARYVLFGCTNE